MKRFSRSTILIALTAFLLLCPLSAQIPSGYVQTTATVPPLANGTYGAAWTNLSSSPQLGLLGCVSTFQTTVNGAIDSKGYFSTLLADTAQICPTPSTWTFTLTFACPGSASSGAFQVAVPVTGGGGTEDITSQITAALPANPCGGGSGGPVFYPSAVQGAIPFVLQAYPTVKLGNSGIIQTGIPGTASQTDTFPGNVAATGTVAVGATVLTAANATGSCQMASSIGFLLDGSDETSKLLALMTTWNANGGGCLAIDSGKTLTTASQVVIPSVLIGCCYHQQPMRITSGAAAGSGTWNLTYAGGPKISTTGFGTLEIDHVNLSDTVDGTQPFIYGTNTILRIHDNRASGKSFTTRAVTDVACSSTSNPTYINSATSNFTSADIGSNVLVTYAGPPLQSTTNFFTTLLMPIASINSTTQAVSSVPCATTVTAAHAHITTPMQDFAVLGGATTATGFGGYGTVIENNRFDEFNAVTRLQTYANGIVVRDNVIQTGGGVAPFVSTGYSSSPNHGGVYTGNVIELPYYEYAFQSSNTKETHFDANSIYDCSGYVAPYRFETTAINNIVNPGALCAVSAMSEGVVGSNQILAPAEGQYTQEQSVIFSGINAKGPIATNFSSYGNNYLFPTNIPLGISVIDTTTSAVPLGISFAAPNNTATPTVSRNWAVIQNAYALGTLGNQRGNLCFGVSASSTLNPLDTGGTCALSISPSGVVTAAGFVATSGATAAVVKNLVPDSDVKLGTTYWSFVSANYFSIGDKIGQAGTNAFVISSAGSGATYYPKTIPFFLVCGQTYTMSGYIDATNVTSGSPDWALWPPTVTVGHYSILSQVAGVASRLSNTFTFAPSGCTAGNTAHVVMIANNANAVITGGTSVLWSTPMIQTGSVATSYGTNFADDDTGNLLPLALGSGTPAAGKYVDGGTGAWTALPTGGAVAASSITAGALVDGMTATSQPATDTTSSKLATQASTAALIGSLATRFVAEVSYCASGCTNGAQSANIASSGSPATLFTPAVAGMYRITATAAVTVTGTGSLAIDDAYTNIGGATGYVLATLPLTGAAGADISSTNGVAFLTAGVPYQYYTTGYTTGTYALMITAEFVSAK